MRFQVAASDTSASFVAKHAKSEALAVFFEALGLGALASLSIIRTFLPQNNIIHFLLQSLLLLYGLFAKASRISPFLFISAALSLSFLFSLIFPIV
jgi:hypothetical protein